MSGIGIIVSISEVQGRVARLYDNSASLVVESSLDDGRVGSVYG